MKEEKIEFLERTKTKIDKVSDYEHFCEIKYVNKYDIPTTLRITLRQAEIETE